MKTLLFTSLAALALISAAPSDALAGRRVVSQDHYRDVTKPPGQTRSVAVWNADLNACYRRTGANRSQPDTPALKSCLSGRGWQWEYFANVAPSHQRREAWSPFRYGGGGGSSTETTSSGPDMNAINAAAAANAANAAAQDMVNQGIADTIQTEIQHNTIYSQGN